MTETVGAVVPTRNSEATLAACLESLRRQTHPAVQVVVVDNYSGDRTVEIARTLADDVVWQGPERSAQRNAGAALAGSDYVFFVDSDMVVGARVVESCVEAARAGAGAVIVPEASFGQGFWARCKALEKRCYVGDDLIEAARFFDRDLFVACGGYDEALVAGEDWDLHERARAAGAAVGRAGELIRHDEGTPTLAALAGKKYAYGKALGAYRHRHPQLAGRQLRVVRPAFVRNWRELACEPQVAAGLLAMKTCEFAAGGAGMAVALVAGRPGRPSRGQTLGV